MSDLHFSDVRGRKLLILGEAGSGKTALTARIISEAVATHGATGITIIDMAPERRDFKNISIGGRVTEFLDEKTKVRVLMPRQELRAPRTDGRTATEVINFARTNAKLIEELLEEYLTNPTPILFINDVSMYLQAGDSDKLLRTVKAAETFIANAYHGTTFLDDHHSGISKRERLGLNALRGAMDIVVELDSKSTLTAQNAVVK